MTVDHPGEACEHAATLAALRELLAAPLVWYSEALDLERCGQVDESYVYDGAIERLERLGRGEAELLLRTLHEAGT